MEITTPPSTGKEKKKTGLIIPIGLTLALIFMGADIIPLSLRPLDYLGMPYPHILRYTHFIAPVAALILWLMLKRSIVVSIIALLLAVYSMTSVAHWADSQPIKIPVRRWTDSGELKAWEKKLGFKVWEQGGNSNGTNLWVDQTPGRADQIRDEVKRMGIAKP